jgi:radical SAM enzyme (TIGR01210 family)
VTAAYPSSAIERTRWILDRRGPRNAVLSDRPYAHLIEQERLGSGAIGDVATIFLTNRECPWKCVMCDLWQNTTISRGAPGNIPAQIQFALDQLAPASVLKLYNSGSFFDAGAIPRRDWKAIAALCNRFEHLIVECHPRLIDQRVLEFKELLSCSLEIALGLETAHPTALYALNKRFTLQHFQQAAAFLKQNGIEVRVFLLVHPPFVPKGEQFDWLTRSARFAFDSGSDVVSLIPLRAGNGAIEELIRHGMAEEPTLRELEAAQEFGVGFGRGRVFADTWDLARFSNCEYCLFLRRERIHRMNLAQEIQPPIRCSFCGNG